MTDQELRDVIASLVLDTQAFKRQLAASQEAADRRAEEADRREKERAEEADKRAKEYAKEAMERSKAADKHSAELDKQIKELGKQLGGLGNKFGSFTEGLLLPSVENILRQKFGITSFQMRLKTRIGEETQELDGFGFVNGEKNIGFIIEVKSHLDRRAIKQTKRELQRFGDFHPEYKGMTLYGIIAAVDAISDKQRDAVFEAGLYLVTVDDDVAEMPKPPRSFTPFSTRA
ncbi:MAG: DUF3782 domain-containing protein [Candidatus Kapaibacterium sp.]|nr:MAG: DUF3782 domain-containing protein [Candidatus Kapabacteria bacterium]